MVPKRRFVPILAAVLIAATVVVSYLPAFRGGFVWDDNDYAGRIPGLSGPSGLAKIWLSPADTAQYYPMSYTSLWLEYQLWGLSPSGYHIDNVILHLLAAALLWLILRRLAVPGAMLAAAVFALHPVHVESVAWVTERKNVLSGVFYLAAALAYLRFAEIRICSAGILPA